jgi:ADP-heptose:LPS heptosyltransferase
LKATLKNIRVLKILLRYVTVLRVAFWNVRRDLLDDLVPLTAPFQSRRKLVLIVRLDAIGDFVLWLDAARTLVSHYHAQGYRVVLLGDQIWASWADEMRLADEVWGLDVERFVQSLAYRWHWSKRIRKAGFSVAIQPTFSFPRRFLLGDSVVRASGAPVRIGSVGDDISGQFKQKKHCLYTQLIPAADGHMMEIKRNAEFMRGLGFNDFKARLPIIPPSLAMQPDKLPPRPYAAIFPGAGWDGREWQAAKFAEIGRRLASRGLSVVLAGGKADREPADEFIKELQGEVIDLVGKTSLSGLAEVLRSAKVVITNETSALHIGVAVGVPVVSILGGGHYGRFAPYDVEVADEAQPVPLVITHSMPCFGCNWVCVYARGQHEPVKCIYDVSVEDVWCAVEKSISRKDLER